MAFAYAVSGVDRGAGRWKRAWGTFTNAATDSGGDIVTGFKTVNGFTASFNSHVGTEPAKHTISGGTVTIVTSEGADGTWQAYGL